MEMWGINPEKLRKNIFLSPKINHVKKNYIIGIVLDNILIEDLLCGDRAGSGFSWRIQYFQLHICANVRVEF